MCRHALLPPGTSRQEALELLRPYAPSNKDGFGYGYVRAGKFVTFHDPKGYWHAIRNGALNDLPEDSWTIAHLRKASEGSISIQNTHPFVHGDYMVSHNGTSKKLIEIKGGLTSLGLGPKWRGETDSEVAAYLVSLYGPKAVAERISGIGTLLVMARNGTVYGIVSKAHYHALDIRTTKGKTIVASDFRMYPKDPIEEMGPGFVSFTRAGRLIKKAFAPRPKSMIVVESGTQSARLLGQQCALPFLRPRHGIVNQAALSLFKLPPRPADHRTRPIMVAPDGRVYRSPADLTA